MTIGMYNVCLFICLNIHHVNIVAIWALFAEVFYLKTEGAVFDMTFGIARLCHIGHDFLKFSLILLNLEIKKYAEKWCDFIIRNYIQT